MRRARNDRGPSGGRKRQETIPRRLDERSALQGKIKKELGVPFARERPEARAGASGGDDDVESGDLADAEGVRA